MKDLRLTIKINKPVIEVFEFTTNPKNTPLWVNSIIYEETNEWPVKLGSTYKNKDRQKNWSSYEVTKFEKDKIFVFSKKNSSYHVKYTFTSLSPTETELEYFEWVDGGELADPFTIDTLQKLKNLMENSK